MHGLSDLIEADKETASLVVQQLADNALLAAGLLDNPHKMTARMNELIGKLVAK
jgi:TNF receptor-associated protein 1